MQKNIPTHDMDKVSGYSAQGQEIFFATPEINFQNLYLHTPYRSNYYGVGVCIDGRITLNANLETYQIEKNCVIAMSPQIIKQWTNRSDNYQTVAVFFTKEFFLKYHSNPHFLDQFAFLDAHASHVSAFDSSQVNIIRLQLERIQECLHSSHLHKNEIVCHLTSILLFEIDALYQTDTKTNLSKLTRGEQLAMAFKKLVTVHFIDQRSVSFYADQLCISAKHLTETIKTETGKTAKEWIEECVILEAKVLLQHPNMTVSDVAQYLHFADQSTFGKYFKNSTQRSPLLYKQKA